MNRPTIQIGDEVRQMTESEHEQWLLDVQLAEQRSSEKEASQAAAKSARAKLAALGLTDDEIVALVG